MPNEEPISQRLCEQVAQWRYEDLPEKVVETVKFFLVDTFGVIGGASRAPGIRELHARLGKWEQTGSATGLLGRRRLSPPTAALANGAAAHALDYDDQYDTARVHSNCVILPTVLATAEDAGGVSGKDFLLAMAVGTEIHARLGLACHTSLGLGWHPTSVLGSLAGSLAAGRVLGLESQGLVNALGMAYHQAAGSAQSLLDGVLSKRLGPGFSARAAVLGAFLAADGLTGTRRSLEGNAGLFALYHRGEVLVDKLMDGLGSDWRILDYSFKPFACCRCNHTVIGLGLDCYKEGIKPSDIQAIEIGLGQYNWDAVGSKYDAARNEVVHAQFNAAYSFARALTDGSVTLAAFQRPAITDPAIAEITARTEAVNDPKIEPSAIHPARVRLTFRDGKVKELYSDTMKGSPRAPMTQDELLAKFYNCLESGLGANRASADAFAEEIFRLEHSSDAATGLIRAFPSGLGLAAATG